MDTARAIFDAITGVVLPFVAVFSGIILVHELGHCLVARACGLTVTRFSLGFGPRLFGWRDRRGTEWVVAAVPLGGFVKVVFDRRLAARAVVIAAGPLANLALAAVLLFLQNAAFGLHDAPPVVRQVFADSPAAQAGFRPGDRILAMNGRTVDGFNQVHRYVALNLDAPVSFEIERDGARRSLVLRPIVGVLELDSGRRDRVGLTGLMGGPVEWIPRDLPTAAAVSVRDTYHLVADTLGGLYQVVTGTREVDSLAGVVGIADMTGTVVETSGLAALLGFVALLSVNIGVLNALPLPALDGGQLVLVGVEALRRRPLPPRVQGYANAVGLGMLATLLVLTTWNDIRFLV